MRKPVAVILSALLSASACSRVPVSPPPANVPEAPPPVTVKPLSANASFEVTQLIASAMDQTKVTTGYDPSYVAIAYPNGDVAPETGVCSDVIVRAFRKVRIDLQKEVHEDMKAAWAVYPKKWGAAGTDTNIDHRRVLNLTTYFERKGKSLPITNDSANYQPGDIVSWDLGNGVEHIGFVVNTWSELTTRYLIVHNIGAGTRMEDVMFAWQVTGHYRYFEK